ncbi:hypothetical protein F0562_008969 [Nyssa sinensis]|uniref:Uncharacterized protein n=1 Tax=Nyssa sinensis TaxID=561372 RepID=A0A5J5AA78_9ASTE|nr:hypothetical protein F0562_008969 [Nyssa sinensis]
MQLLLLFEFRVLRKGSHFQNVGGARFSSSTSPDFLRLSVFFSTATLHSHLKLQIFSLLLIFSHHSSLSPLSSPSSTRPSGAQSEAGDSRHSQGYCPSRSTVSKFCAEVVYFEFMKQCNIGVYFSLRR